MWTRGGSRRDRLNSRESWCNRWRPKTKRSTGPVILKTGELLPQFLATPGHCPIPAEPTFETKQSMNVDHNMRGDPHQSEETHHVRNGAHPVWPLTLAYDASPIGIASFTPHHGGRLRKTHGIRITNLSKGKRQSHFYFTSGIPSVMKLVSRRKESLTDREGSPSIGVGVGGRENFIFTSLGVASHWWQIMNLRPQYLTREKLYQQWQSLSYNVMRCF